MTGTAENFWMKKAAGKREREREREREKKKWLLSRQQEKEEALSLIFLIFIESKPQATWGPRAPNASNFDFKKDELIK